jgi:hypothetical protein
MGKRNKRRKSSYKPKYKGVRYLTTQLQTKWKKRYKDKTLARSRAYELLDVLRSKGLKVNLENLYLLERRHRDTKLDVVKAEDLGYEIPPTPFYQFNNAEDLTGFNGILLSNNQVKVVFASDGVIGDYEFEGTGLDFANAFRGSDMIRHLRKYYNNTPVAEFNFKGLYDGVMLFEIYAPEGMTSGNGESKSVSLPSSEEISDIDKQIELEKLRKGNLELELKKEMIMKGYSIEDINKFLNS